jgi:hypothetical protein
MRVDAVVGRLTLTACTLDPSSSADGTLVITPADPTKPILLVLSRSITGGLRLAPGVTSAVAADTILDQQGGLAVSGLTPPGATPGPSPPAGAVQLERVTVFGEVLCGSIVASECLLCDLVQVDDPQTGCLRFTRFEPGSLLPRRYRCQPSEPHGGAGAARRVLPVFTSLSFGRPGYAQLAAGSAPELLTASEQGSEIGAFAAALNTIRLVNLQTKLQEFLPVGMIAMIIAET